MQAPLRIVEGKPTMRIFDSSSPAVGVEAAAAEVAQTPVAKPAASSGGFNSYLDRLVKLIPGESTAFYLVGAGVIPATANPLVILGWSIVCLLSVIAIKALGTSDLKQGVKPDWIHIGISSVSFILWVYTLGGPFAAYHIQVPYLGSLAVLIWTFFLPIIYKGSLE